MGQKIHVVTNPRTVGSVFNNTKSLSFDSFLHDVMLEFGTSEAGCQTVMRKHDNNKSILQLAHDLQVRQTQGDELRRLGACMIHIFQRQLSFDSISSFSTVNFAEVEKATRIVSLKDWTVSCFVEAGQQAYFGEALAKIDPDIPATMMAMDESSWQIFYKYPKFCRPKLERMCDRIRSAMRQYIALPEAERKPDAWFTNHLIQRYRDSALSDEDIASQLLALYWGINTNVSKVGFWMIAHLLERPELIDIIRKETAPAFEDTQDTISDATQAYSNAPVLNAVWLETLRLSAASTTMRGITQDFVLGDTQLRAGYRVLVSARQQHLRTQEFGPDARTFDHERFLQQPGLERSPAFRPFGGGPTVCPGRLLSKHMTLNFVALLFRRFDVALDGPQVMPTYEESKPAIGVMGGQGDLRIRLTPRAIS
jgi:hypothetical protein